MHEMSGYALDLTMSELIVVVVLQKTQITLSHSAGARRALTIRAFINLIWTPAIISVVRFKGSCLAGGF